MSLLQNLALRTRLLRLALTKRFVYHDIVAIAESYGPKIADVCGNIEPVELTSRLAAHHNIPTADFSALRSEDLIMEHGHTVYWSSEPSAARFLGRLALVHQARTVIEVGCFIGWTTAHIATALRQLGRGGRVHYLDCDAGNLANATANLRRTSLDPWTIPHQGSSLDPAVLAKLPARADIIFIDTTHAYDQTRAEIDHYGSRIAADGCLVLHDSISMPGVRRAVQDVRGRFDVCTFATERSNGVTVLLPR